MGKQTPFYDLHVKAHAKIVDFAGWDMPLHYGSQLEEHRHVRQNAGMFDVSHMGVVDIKGKEAHAFLRFLLANNVDRLVDGKAFYTCMLNESGGVIDDLIVYRINPDTYRIVVNAGTREKDIAWMRANAKPFAVDIIEQPALAILAVQGPAAKEKLLPLLPETMRSALNDLKPFHFVCADNVMIARTGYTGEEGFEMIFPREFAEKWWQDLLKAGVLPCGLGARDTLRLEAGLNLYGSDMDETITPFEANLAWTVIFNPEDRSFIGKQALIEQKETGIPRQLVGLVLQGPGIIRNHQKVILNNQEMGEITSGGYSPTLEKSIALARIPTTNATACLVEIRHKQVPAQIINPPFVRHGKKMFKEG